MKGSNVNENEAPMTDGLFVTLLTRFEPEIRAYIRASVPSPHDVAEVMQNVSLVAWKKFSDLDHPESNFAKWMCVIARFEILKFRRTKARDRFVLDDSLVEILCVEGESEMGMRTQQMRQLEHCLNVLPSERRDLVLRAYTPCSSIKSLAEQLGKQPAATYQLLKRIRRELESCILRRLSDEGAQV